VIIQLSGLFPYISILSNVFHHYEVQAQSPTSPIFSVYRDSAWWEAITATAQTLSWDTPVSTNSEIPINGVNNSFDLQVW